MSKVYGAIIKHRLRTTRNMLRHYWPSTAGSHLRTCIPRNRLLALAWARYGVPAGVETSLLPAWALYHHDAYRTFIQETPTITVNAATLHHLYHTSYFQEGPGGRKTFGHYAKNMPDGPVFSRDWWMGFG